MTISSNGGLDDKCIRCGWPCEAALFMSSVNCSNPKCPFYLSELDQESRQLVLDLVKATDAMKELLR